MKIRNLDTGEISHIINPTWIKRNGVDGLLVIDCVYNIWFIDSDLSRECITFEYENIDLSIKSLEVSLRVLCEKFGRCEIDDEPFEKEYENLQKQIKQLKEL
jgi:hypothetical protein